jgi:hypothetical protein
MRSKIRPYNVPSAQLGDVLSFDSLFPHRAGNLHIGLFNRSGKGEIMIRESLLQP